LDGTLLTQPVLVGLSRKLGVEEELRYYDDLMRSGRMTKSACLRKQYALFGGIRVDRLVNMMKRVPRIKGIRETVQRFQSHGLSVIVLSDNLTFLLDFFLKFGFDATIGSRAVINDGVFAGRAVVAAEKLVPLQRFCRAAAIELSECIHVGDWDNDIPVFRAVGLPVAINPKNHDVRKYARIVVESDNLLRVYRMVGPALNHSV
jgi:HAD superfamily phosphoserine phosphatase-like hydrolase